MEEGAAKAPPLQQEVRIMHSSCCILHPIIDFVSAVLAVVPSELSVGILNKTEFENSNFDL